MHDDTRGRYLDSPLPAVRAYLRADEARTTARTAFGLTLYLDDAPSWSRAHAGALFRAFRDLTGDDRFRYWSTGAAASWNPVDEDFLEETSGSLSTGTSTMRHQFGIALVNDVGAPSFGFEYKEFDPGRDARRSYVRLTLPLDHDPADLLQLAILTSNTYPIRYGVGGFVGRANPRIRRTSWSRLYGWSRRYLGMHLSHPERWTWRLDAGIPTPNWITMLGRGCMEDFSIVPDTLVHREWNHDVVAMPLPNALLLRAGEAPSLGDRNMAAYPEAIAEVAGVLDAWVFEDPASLPGTFEEEELTHAWLHRFAFPEQWI